MIFLRFCGTLSLVILFSFRANAQNAGSVERSVVTSGVEDREPVDQIDTVFVGTDKVFFFTELQNFTGNQITHKWSHAGEVRAEVTFNVQGSRWRVFSSKNLVRDWLGDWSLQVVDSSGTVLNENSFVYSAAESMKMTETTEAESTTQTEQLAGSGEESQAKSAKPNPDDSQDEGQGMAKPQLAATGAVARAIFTSAVTDREPVDQLETIDTGTEKIFFFTELRDMQGQTIVHRWKHENEVLAEVSFDVGGPRWRVHSSKNLAASWTGNWTVEVVDSENNVLSSASFVYSKADE